MASATTLLPQTGTRWLYKSSGQIVTITKEHFEEGDNMTGTYTVTTDEGDDIETTVAGLAHECELDIGGEVFKVPLDALCGEHEGDVLGKVEDEPTGPGNYRISTRIEIDELCPDDVRFIDGDPEFFPIIMAYLEQVKCWRSDPFKEVATLKLPKRRSSLKKIKQEAQFYQLKGLCSQVDAKLFDLLEIA